MVGTVLRIRQAAIQEARQVPRSFTRTGARRGSQVPREPAEGPQRNGGRHLQGSLRQFYEALRRSEWPAFGT